ncbi:hypothetical protein K458DRAFT_486850 [Lentithecium fluviatile CBS 122367]|uniref:Uncharacterized protein n=1 Tax=Lentithecium fluviatile CBS 122367 TaxID=1168545 RepID=A0A6G1J526_9PLEO|nr:hypothetical protein K458DRAFT_486850 [Lentithecium fluviatile CBS 122367]
MSMFSDHGRTRISDTRGGHNQGKERKKKALHFDPWAFNADTEGAVGSSRRLKGSGMEKGSAHRRESKHESKPPKNTWSKYNFKECTTGNPYADFAAPNPHRKTPSHLAPPSFSSSLPPSRPKDSFRPSRPSRREGDPIYDDYKSGDAYGDFSMPKVECCNIAPKPRSYRPSNLSYETPSFGEKIVLRVFRHRITRAIRHPKCPPIFKDKCELALSKGTKEAFEALYYHSTTLDTLKDLENGDYDDGNGHRGGGGGVAHFNYHEVSYSGSFPCY